MKRRDVLFAAGGAALAAVSHPVTERVSAQATPAASPVAMADDERFMRMALDEAKQGAQQGDFPFGAVIVRDGQVLVRAHNTGHQDDDPTAHGEMNAIRAFLAAHGSEALKGTTLYTTGEPCVMCTGAIIWCGIGRIVYAASVDQLATTLGQIAIGSAQIVARESFAPIAITGGVLSEEALALFR
jgi:tRNA(adenine34) deaminase